MIPTERRGSGDMDLTCYERCSDLFDESCDLDADDIMELLRVDDVPVAAGVRRDDDWLLQLGWVRISVKGQRHFYLHLSGAWTVQQTRNVPTSTPHL